MQLAIVTGIYPPDIGGPASHAADLRSALRNRGHTVEVVTLADADRAARSDGVIRLPRRWPWPRRIVAAARAVVRVRPDVIYGVGMHETAALAAILARCPLVLRVPGDHAWERAWRLGLTSLSFEEFQRARGGTPRVRLMRWMRTWAVRRATAVIVPSEYLAATVRRWAPGIQAQVVRIGVAGNQWRCQQRETRRGQLRAVWVGRMVGWKKLDVLLEAVALTSGVELKLIGDGPERGAVATHIERLGVGGRVHLIGELPREHVAAHLAGADVLVLASAYEGLPHVAVEALACGTPVVAPAAPWAREVVADGETGVLVSEATPEAFAEILGRLRDDVEWRSTLARQATARAGQWTLEAVVDRIEAVLRYAVRPRAVFVGKGGLEPPGSLRSKFEVLARHLKAAVVSVRPPGPVPPVPLRVVAFPRRPKVAASILFYTMGPVVAVALAACRRGVVVCQSPYEGAVVQGFRWLLPKGYRPRVLVEVHGDWRAASRLYGSLLRRLLAPAADRVAVWALRHADRVRAVSAEMERLVREAGYAGPVDRFVAYSDFAHFLDAALAPLPEEPVALFVGVLERHKGVDVLLDAFAGVLGRIPAAELWIVGEGPRRAELEAQAARLGVWRQVRFLGARPRAELLALMDRARLLVLPSRSEGLPRVIIEAMARARPVVASRVGGIPEVVEHGVTGLVVPPANADALAEALILLLTDRNLAERMGREGRRRAEARDPSREFAEGTARMAAWAAGSKR
ncbi:MAG: glycosyltransferase family 4 protein [Armatimonadota bacterium]|nr:glycosyltransferase family 4 protein [Armatimonadota bacterium]